MITDDLTPTLSPGLTHLDAPSARTPALHQLTLATLADLEGRAYWIDSRSTASTYTWLEGATHPRRLEPLRVARAFTAYQHHSLTQTVTERATEDDLVIVPCLDSLYADDDVPEPQARTLLADTVDALEGLAADGVTVLVTATDPTVTTDADHTIVARETRLGTAFEADDTETTLYRGVGFWQTTIPYWVDLVGVSEPDTVELLAAPEPVQLALG